MTNRKSKRSKERRRRLADEETTPKSPRLTANDMPVIYPPFRWTTDGNYLSPYTVGGDGLSIEKRLNATEEVLTQRDKSLNKKLWKLYTIDRLMKTLIDRGSLAHARAPWPSPSIASGQLAAKVETHAVDQLCQLMVVLDLTNTDLLRLRAEGDPPPSDAQRLYQSPVPTEVSTAEREHHVDPVAVTVGRVRAQWNLARNQLQTTDPAAPDLSDVVSQTLSAMLGCLYDLLPWCATPLIFSGKKAFEAGVAQLRARSCSTAA